MGMLFKNLRTEKMPVDISF